MQAEEHCDLSHFAKQPMELISPRGWDRDSKLEVLRDGKTVHFDIKSSASEVTLVFAATPKTTLSVPLKVPRDEISFDMPLRDAATYDWHPKVMHPGDHYPSTRFTLYSKPDAPWKPKIDLVLLRDVPVFKQHTNNDCWFATTMMLMSWKFPTPLQSSDFFSRVDPNYQRIYKADTGLDSKQFEQLAQELGLKGEPPASYPLDVMLEWLKAGPVEVTIDSLNHTILHAVVVIGACGDGTAAGSTIRFIDPSPGQDYYEMTYTEFLKLYEAPGHDAALIRVIHF